MHKTQVVQPANPSIRTFMFTEQFLIELTSWNSSESPPITLFTFPVSSNNDNDKVYDWDKRDEYLRVDL